MTIRFLAGTLLAATVLGARGPDPAVAQQVQFVPVLSYRTGPYAPNGIPEANGVVDYLELVNQRDGGINGVKIQYEECETGYATDRGVECYESLKGQGPTGAAFILLLPIFLDNVLPPLASLLHLPFTNATVSHIQLMVFGGLIIFFLIVEPHGLARLWQIAKEKLRLWPFPH